MRDRTVHKRLVFGPDLPRVAGFSCNEGGIDPEPWRGGLHRRGALLAAASEDHERLWLALLPEDRLIFLRAHGEQRMLHSVVPMPYSYVRMPPAIGGVRRILVTGFPHCGTSIVKCKLGECDNVHEHPFEAPAVTAGMVEEALAHGKDTVVIKHPVIPAELLNARMDPSKTETYRDYAVVFLLRHPARVFASILRRFTLQFVYQRARGHHVPDYERAAQLFLACRAQPRPQVLPIKYEELFEDGGARFLKLMAAAGLRHAPDILSRQLKPVHLIEPRVLQVPERRPACDQHGLYRTWQINQAFRNMDDDAPPAQLPDDMAQQLRACPAASALYQHLEAA